MRPVVSGKLPYVRFDRNSYSIPHTHVRRPLTLLASATTVRLVVGAEEIARHGRSYDTGATIEDPTHLDGLLTATQQAQCVEHAGSPAPRRPDHGDALGPLWPSAAMRCGRTDPVTRAPRRLWAAGTRDRRRRSRSARDALGAGSIAHILETRRRHRGQAPSVPMILPDRPGVRDLDDHPASLGVLR